MIDEHADDLIGEALGAAAAEVQALAENLAEWWKDPRLDDALIGFEAEVKREIGEWFDNNRSQIGRRIDRMAFAASPQGFRTAEQTPDGASEADNPTSTVLHESSRFAGTLGHRDVIYPIGKFFNVKFKPWGATRAGARVARAGAVLGVVATAFDIYSWVRDSQRESARETARRSAVEYIRATAPEIVEHILSGGEEGNGPAPYLADQSEALETMRADLADGRRQCEEMVELATSHIEVYETLLDALAQIDPSHAEETT